MVVGVFLVRFSCHPWIIRSLHANPGILRGVDAAAVDNRQCPDDRHGQTGMSYREGRFWQPDVTVATVVVRDGRLLCVEERVNGSIVINQPAGHLEPDESLFDAALR